MKEEDIKIGDMIITQMGKHYVVYNILEFMGRPIYCGIDPSKHKEKVNLSRSSIAVVQPKPKNLFWIYILRQERMKQLVIESEENVNE